ncbi:MAG: FMN-dependent NADH-azoreductase [Rhizobiales bacterium 65-79]|jgi:FMN-dependent NADH-azoreductase|nr:NAD(P)H-dependent oxidoreductase [Hyphomicrobiales bacterium]OJU00179.1 MAG: FMN-dependent NADH-azoreductase [Rhizobiales bacterium 65-79]
MSNVLLILSSPRGEASLSTKVARSLADAIAGQRDASLTVRDLGANPPAHIDSEFVVAATAPSENPTEAQKAAAEESDRLIAEIAAADTLVIGAAMINFAVTSPLKSWFDRIAVRGKTFRYTETGPEGLLKGKKAYVVMASAGVYSDGPTKAIDFASPYIRHMLGFMGITDVEVIRVEGLAFGAEAAEKAISGAMARAGALAEAHGQALAA